LRKPKREKKQEAPAKPAGPVDLDVATEKEIEGLRHIGPTLANGSSPTVTPSVPSVLWMVSGGSEGSVPLW
jgi:hypothetical protein